MLSLGVACAEGFPLVGGLVYTRGDSCAVDLGRWLRACKRSVGLEFLLVGRRAFLHFLWYRLSTKESRE